MRLSIRSVLFILLAYFSDGIVDTVLKIGGTPYHWIMDSDLPALSFADFNSVMLAIIGVCAKTCPQGRKKACGKSLNFLRRRTRR